MLPRMLRDSFPCLIDLLEVHIGNEQLDIVENTSYNTVLDPYVEFNLYLSVY
jgi:hypothetical protein